MKTKRKVAAHEVHVDGQTIRQCIVEIDRGNVVRYYPFTDEQPMTEWLGGTITIRKDEEKQLAAYWNGQRLE